MTDTKQIIPILEALAATSEVMPWGVSAVYSLECVLLWDARSESSFVIIDSVVGDDGDSIETGSISIGDEEQLIGSLVKLKTTRYSNLTSFAGVLRGRYAIATGPNPKATDRPF